MRVQRRTVDRLIALATRPGGMPAAMAEAGLVTHQHVTGTKAVPVRYLALRGVDVVIASISLSGLVGCEASQVSHRAFDGAAERCTQYVRGAICTPCTASARQIGTTPNRSRCSLMNAPITGVANSSAYTLFDHISNIVAQYQHDEDHARARAAQFDR